VLRRAPIQRSTARPLQLEPRRADREKNALVTAAKLRTEAAALERRANEFLSKAEALRKAADMMDAAEGRPTMVREEATLAYGENPSILRSVNTEGFSQSLLISAGKAKDALVRAANSHRLTMGQLLEKVRHELKLKRLPASGISQARRGTRPIRRDVAEAIQRLTGFEASRANWPGGIKDPADGDM